MKKYQIQIIACLYCDLQADTISKVLQMYDCDVIVSRVGCSDDFISLINGTNIYENTDLIVICAHGCDDFGVRGIIAASCPSKPNDYDIVEIDRMQFPCTDIDIPIINLGCWTGTEDFAKVFLQNGCNCYIASSAELDNRDSTLFMSVFAYYFFVKELTIDKAYLLSNKMVNCFKIFKKGEKNEKNQENRNRQTN